MLDNLSNGRLELGVGRGIVPMEAEHYDVKFEEGREMFHEALDILIMGLTQDTLDYEGKHYNLQGHQDVGRAAAEALSAAVVRHQQPGLGALDCPARV